MDPLTRVSIVIPIYKHSGLLIEAIESSLLQECPFAYNIILVNDGCPFENTHKICKAYAELYSNKIYYINKVNGGLSSARNAGVNFALKNYPNLRAIYFLDADNRILPCLLKNSYEILDSDANIGWVYPNIDMFGLKIRNDYELENVYDKYKQEQDCIIFSIEELFRCIPKHCVDAKEELTQSNLSPTFTKIDYVKRR